MLSARQAKGRAAKVHICLAAVYDPPQPAITIQESLKP
jgi:hypothetical protein